MAKFVAVEKGKYITVKVVKGDNGSIEFVRDDGKSVTFNAQDLVPLGPARKFEHTIDMIGKDDFYLASKELLKVAERYADDCGAPYFGIDILESGHISQHRGTVRELEMFVQPYVMRK